jgi:hypothetical protein
MRKISLVAALLLSSSAMAGKPAASTPSGLPEAVFTDTTLVDAEGKIASACMDKGWQITVQTTNQVTCQVPFGGFKQALAGALLGNSYSTPPNVFAAFSMAQVGPNVRVQARAWMETQMAFGQVRTMQYDDSKSKTGLMSFLTTAGAQLPNGTVFNTPWIGFTNRKDDTSAINVTHIFTGSPAQRSGLAIGDQITTINGKTFKTVADFANRLAKISDAAYTLSVMRAGQPMTLTVTRRTIPAVGTPEYAALKKEADTFKDQ